MLMVWTSQFVSSVIQGVGRSCGQEANVKWFADTELWVVVKQDGPVCWTQQFVCLRIVRGPSAEMVNSGGWPKANPLMPQMHPKVEVGRQTMSMSSPPTRKIKPGQIWTWKCPRCISKSQREGKLFLWKDCGTQCQAIQLEKSNCESLNLTKS